MAWEATFSISAERDIARLDKPTRKRVLERIEWLTHNFDSVTPLPLGGKYKGFYKLRAGDWRIFYVIHWDSETLTIEYIDHRSRAYK